MTSANPQKLGFNDEKAIAHDEKPGDEFFIKSIAQDICDNMQDDTVYILGPGKTTREITRKLGIDNHNSGVNIIKNRKLLESGIEESELVQLVNHEKTKLIVTPSDEDDRLFTDETKRLTVKIIDKIGKQGIQIIATPTRIEKQRGAPFIANTGDPKTDQRLSGFFPIITSKGRRAIYKISPPE
ncbi:MAG: hypothetical protein NWE89_00150 [Candidatus Bathyarchaeota archaeon]|nr:hypothetical protein [Candidatus Bathyarchaeota archaeon]